MVDETPDDADNEITRIVRRPGPQSLPINIVKPLTPAAPSSPAQPQAPASAPAIPQASGPGFSPVPPISAAPQIAPPVMAPNASPLVAHRTAANDIAPPVTPPASSERSRPMMTPPGRPVPPLAATPSVPATPVAAPMAPSPVVPAQAAQVQAAPASAEPAKSIAPSPQAPVSSPAAASAGTVIDPVVGWLVVIKGPGRGAARDIVTGRNSLGRAAGQDIRIDFGDPAIAPQGHLYIVYDEEGREFVVEDGKQKVVVRLNGKLLTETMPIGNGDDLRIGATTLRFIALCGPGFDWHEPEASNAASADTPEEAEGSGTSAAEPVAGATPGLTQ